MGPTERSLLDREAEIDPARQQVAPLNIRTLGRRTESAKVRPIESTEVGRPTQKVKAAEAQSLQYPRHLHVPH